MIKHQSNGLHGVYKITNKINGKVYIGMTESNIPTRWCQHIRSLKKNGHDNRNLQEDFNTYGIECFEFTILEMGIDKSRLNKIEQKYINKYAVGENYNLINSDMGIKADKEMDVSKFINFINKKWLVPKGITNKKDLDKYKIYKSEDKEEIVKMVAKCNLLKTYYSRITFNKVVDLMQNKLGYTIESKQGMTDKKRETYKLVIDFDEDKVDMKSERVR